MTDDTVPEPDRTPGAPHPRATPRLFGQAAAEAAFLAAFYAGRLHHAWLLSGPRGIGKATLAWRIARFLLAAPEARDDGLFGGSPPPGAPDRTLDVAPDHPVARHMLALAEPRLHLVRRGGMGRSEADREKAVLEGRFSADIRVDEVRRLARFLHLSATDGGRRAVIVDCADEMNDRAANALLKMLEEPPKRTAFLLVSHRPSGLLPTIRSRCRDLRLAPLGAGDLAAALVQAGADPGDDAPRLAELSGGSVGAAMRLVHLDGLALYADLVALLDGMPALDRPRAIALAEAAAARGAEDRRDLFFHLVDLVLARLARTGATGAPPPEAAPGEATMLARLAPGPARARAWAALAEEAGARARRGRAVNRDPAALGLATVIKQQSCARA